NNTARSALQKIEIRPEVGLLHMIHVQIYVSSQKWISFFIEGLTPRAEFLVGNFKLQAAVRNIQFYDISGANHCKIAALRGLRRNMQNDGTESRTAHSAVGDPHH